MQRERKNKKRKKPQITRPGKKWRCLSFYALTLFGLSYFILVCSHVCVTLKRHILFVVSFPIVFDMYSIKAHIPTRTNKRSTNTKPIVLTTLFSSSFSWVCHFMLSSHTFKFVIVGVFSLCFVGLYTLCDKSLTMR